MLDYRVAMQVMQQRCTQIGAPLDVHWTANSFCDLLPRVREDSRPYVETTIRVLDDMTDRYGERGHTVADVSGEVDRRWQIVDVAEVMPHTDGQPLDGGEG